MSETDNSVKPVKKRKIADVEPTSAGDHKPESDYPNLKRHCNKAERASDTDRSDFIVKALQKLNELQQLLGHYDSEHEDSEYEDDGSADEEAATDEFVSHGAEALGFAVCAQETLTFLHRHGLDAGDDVVQRLRERLIGEQRSVGGSCP